MISFQNPYFLIGTLTAAVPLLIFLLTRDSIKKVAFSTLRFFAGNSAALVKRKRWQDALLLAMRAGVCALLALAFARPFLQEATSGGPLRAAHAIVLLADVSASMAQPGVTQQERDVLTKAIDELPRDSLVTLITFDKTPRVEAPWTRSSTEVRSKAANVAAGAGGTDLAAAIRKAQEALDETSATEKQILVVSDLQRTAWDGFTGTWKLEPGVKLDLRPVKTDAPAGAAIVAADYPQGIVYDTLAHPITVRVANHGSTPIADLPIRFQLNDGAEEQQQINLPAGESFIVRFRTKFDHVGDNKAVVRIGATAPASDAPLGSTLYFNTRMIPKIDVAILSSPVPAGKAARSPTFFLEKALAPADDSPFVVHSLSIATATPTDLASAAAVILAGVDTVNPDLRGALDKVLARGGGLLFLPGPRTSAEAFSKNFADLAPCKLRRIVQANETRRGDAKALLTRINFEHPILQIFELPHFGDFATVRFNQYWEVSDSQLAKVLARFDDGRPYMLEKTVGAGSTLLLASPVETAWNNLAQRAIFLPFLHQATRYLAKRTEPQTAYLVGDALPIAAEHQLRDPAGELHAGPSLVAAAPGFYTLLDGGGSTAMTYAVNTDFAELNPATMAAEEIAAALEPPPNSAGASTQAIAGLAQTGGAGLWAYVVMAVLLLSLAELFLSNRVARH